MPEMNATPEPSSGELNASQGIHSGGVRAVDCSHVADEIGVVGLQQEPHALAQTGRVDARDRPADDEHRRGRLRKGRHRQHELLSRFPHIRPLGPAKFIAGARLAAASRSSAIGAPAAAVACSRTAPQGNARSALKPALSCASRRNR
jgi:hypothetical protein